MKRRCAYCQTNEATADGVLACENCATLARAGKLVILPVIRIERYLDDETAEAVS